MPQEISRLYFHDGLDSSGQRYFWILDLNTDASSFWSVIERHALNSYRPIFGSDTRWAVQGLEQQTPRDVVPLVAEFVRLFRTGGWRDETVWDGATLAWETLGPERIRVVVGPTNDLLSNLMAAKGLLDVIYKVYPESRGDLDNYENVLSNLAYTKEIRDKFLDYVQQVKAIRANEQRKTHRPATYVEKELNTTLVHYLHEVEHKSVNIACQLAGGSPTTYRNHKKLGKLLTAEDFQRRTGMTLAAAAQHPEQFKQ